MTVSSGNTRVLGDVGLGPVAQMDFSGGGVITGRLDRDAGSSVNVSGGSQIQGGVNIIDMNPAWNDMRAAASLAAAQSPTQTFASLGNGATIFGSGFNVIDVTGNVNLSGGGTLTLSGSSLDTFIVNVLGAMTVGGGSSVDLAGGLTPGHVLWNFVGVGPDVNLNGNSDLVGTFLAAERSIIVSGGTVTGALLSGGDRLVLQSGPEVTFNPLVVPVPEPASSLLAFIGLGIVGAVRRRFS
jgi:choice-of-anchor A domain-containing protein